MYAIHGAGIDARGVLCPDAGFGNDIWHGSPPRSSPYAFHKEDSRVAEVNSWRMEPTIETISAVTLRVANMMKSVRFTGMFLQGIAEFLIWNPDAPIPDPEMVVSILKA